MVASDKTIELALQVILRHVDVEIARKILADMERDVPGNKSFRATISGMSARLKLLRISKSRNANKRFLDTISDTGRTPRYDDDDGEST